MFFPFFLNGTLLGLSHISAGPQPTPPDEFCTMAKHGQATFDRVGKIVYKLTGHLPDVG